MQITVHHRYLRMSPKKVRLVANAITGLPVSICEDQLKFLNKRASKPIIKLLLSAVANAKNAHELPKESLFVKSVVANEGPMLKRWRARAFGRAAPIRKRSTHITMTLGVSEQYAEKKALAEAKKKTISAPELVSDLRKAMKKFRKDKEEVLHKAEHDHAHPVKPGEENKETEALGGRELKGPVDKDKIPAYRRGFMKKFFSRKTG